MLDVSTEKAIEPVTAAVELSKRDLVEFAPGDPEFNSAAEFLSLGDLFLSAIPEGVSRLDAIKAVLAQVNSARASKGKNPIPAFA